MTGSEVPVFHRPDGVYLLSHSVGLPPEAALDHVRPGCIDVWRNDPARAWPSWLAEIDRFRNALASLLNHRSAWFCPQSNVSSALSKIIHAIPLRLTRPTILLAEQAFPSVGFVIARACGIGHQLKFVGRDENAQDPAVWAHQMTPDVGAVIITHVHSDTGQLIPAGRIVAEARGRDIVSIVDVAQSAGIVPIDLSAWDADFVVGSCVKWLCGGPGAGYLWVNPSMIERCQPLDLGWFSHVDPFEFDIHRFRYAPDALRFWGGTPSVLPATIAGRSIELLTSIGLDRIRAANRTLVDQLIAHVADDELVSPRDPALRGGTVVVSSGRSTDRLAEELARADIHIDRRPSGIRLSPHIYNNRDDIDQVTAVLVRRAAFGGR